MSTYEPPFLNVQSSADPKTDTNKKLADVNEQNKENVIWDTRLLQYRRIVDYFK